MNNNPKIVFLGTGAIGQSVGGWIAPHYNNLYFLDQGEVADTLKKKGIRLFEMGGDKNAAALKVKVLDDIKEIKGADVIVLGVKNYSLDAVAKNVRSVTGDTPIIIGMQNGLANQEILPRYFSRVMYCIIGYNAWIDSPGVIGYQKKGPLIIGTADNRLSEEMKIVVDIFNRGVQTIVTDHLQDAVHCKIIINLTNSLVTLVGHGFKPISDESIFQTLLTSMLYEGVQIVKAAGIRECKIGGMPPWIKLKLGATFPQFITRPLFRKNVKKMVVSSMAQDIIQRKGHDSELDTINGYIIRLADRHGLAAPFNRTIYDLCARTFSKPVFEPMDVKDVLAEVQKKTAL